MSFRSHISELSFYRFGVMAVTCLIFCACVGDSNSKTRARDSKINTAVLITDPDEQDSLFKSLMNITGKIIPASKLDDSLAFLLLPVQASCPSCREKTIDSISRHEHDLPSNHYIIIAGNGGRKTLGSYFREQKTHIPELSDQLILDTINQSSRLNLYTDNTIFFYAVNRKVYRKVPAVPDNVKRCLHVFFSGKADD